MNVFGPHVYHNQNTENETKYCFVYRLMALLCLFLLLDIYGRTFRLFSLSSLEALSYGGPLIAVALRCVLLVAGQESNPEPTLRQTGALTI
jgi:hypothetical protein